MAERTNLPKSTIHNIFSTFHQYGLLEYVEQTKRYRLGPKAVELGNVYHQSNSFVSIMRPYLSRLAETTQERVYLGKMTADGSVLYLDMAYPQSSITSSDIIGVKAPLYCTGIGKAILAFRTRRWQTWWPSERWKNSPSTPLPKPTNCTPSFSESARAAMQ